MAGHHRPLAALPHPRRNRYTPIGKIYDDFSIFISKNQQVNAKSPRPSHKKVV